MKIGQISADRLFEKNFWLVGSFHLSEAEQYQVLLSHFPNEELGELLSVPPFYGSRSKRIYVEDANSGIAYLSNSDMLSVSPLDQCRFVSKKLSPGIEADNLKPGWVLVSRVGTIGQVAYTREDFLGSAGSDNIFRLIPSSKILSGYLYTFISSKIGIAFMQKLATGGVQDYIDGKNLSKILIPRLGSAVEEHIHALVEQAATLRVQANRLLEQAKNEIEQHVGFRKSKHSFDHAYSLGTASIDPNFGMRLDAFGYVGYVEDALKTLDNYPGKVVAAPEVGYEIFSPPIFKRMFADSGYPYMSGVNIYNLHPLPERYLSRLQPDVDQYLIRKGMVLVQSAGQRYGLITKPLFVTETLDGVAVTSDVVRISHADPIENGYICGLFSTNFGRRLALRYSYGTSIPRLDVPKFSLIKIPYPEDNFRRRIGKFVVDAYQQREQANVLEDQAQAALSKALHT